MQHSIIECCISEKQQARKAEQSKEVIICCVWPLVRKNTWWSMTISRSCSWEELRIIFVSWSMHREGEHRAKHGAGEPDHRSGGESEASQILCGRRAPGEVPQEVKCDHHKGKCGQVISYGNNRRKSGSVRARQGSSYSGYYKTKNKYLGEKDFSITIQIRTLPQKELGSNTRR